MRKNTRFHYIDLMLKFLEGNSTEEEDDQLSAWLREAPEHLELFEEIRLNWRSTPQHTSAALHAYDRISRRLDLPQETFPQQSSGRAYPSARRLIPWAAVFAGFLLMAFSGYYLFFRTSATTYRTGYAEIRTFRLPDSSLVTLNANSTLTLAANWREQDHRRADLDGEAFFEVKRKRQQAAPDSAFKKFIVSTDNLEVEVLGTAFNVNSRRKETKVALNSGSIRLKLRENDQEILMEPGDFVEVAATDEPVIRKGVDVVSYSTWKDGKLYLDGSTIGELQTLLLDNYGIRIRFEAPELTREVRLRGTFPSTDPGLLLKAIADVTRTEQVKDGDQVYYKQKDKLK